MQFVLKANWFSALLFLLLKISIGFAQNIYEYDVLNRIQRIEYSEGITIEFSYDNIGNRQSKIIIAESENNTLINTKSFLQGPFNQTSNSLNSHLNEYKVIPQNQPYNKQPWNYAGSESVASIPKNIVDWILIELRTGPVKNTAIVSRAAFLKNDGIIVDLDGISPVEFPVLEPGNYYIVLYHRNHLSVMSKNPVELKIGLNSYDFTTGQDKAYGEEAMFELSPNIYGMRSGDGNSDGKVDENDRTEVWRPQNGTEWSYDKYGDFNLDRGIDAIDLNLQWRKNEGYESQVPQGTLSKSKEKSVLLKTKNTETIK